MKKLTFILAKGTATHGSSKCRTNIRLEEKQRIFFAGLSKCALFFLCVLMMCSCVTPKKFKAYQKEQEGITANLQARNVELEQEISTLKATYSNQVVTIASLQNSVTSLATELSITENKLQNVQTIMNNLGDNITKCQKEISGMEPRIKSLEEYRQNQCVFTESDCTGTCCSDGCKISEQFNNSNQAETAPDFSLVDNYVFNISYDDTNPDNYKYLVDLITRNANTKYEKARAIYIWLANNISYDLDLKIYDADNTFRQRKGVCDGYSKLYKRLCELAGLEVERVVGVIRYDTYKKGDNIDNKRHAWNAVKGDDGRTFLVDVTWSAGGVNPQGEYVKCLEPMWFDPDPAVFALTHLPDNSKWQLIDNPITREEFENFPSMYPNVALMGINGNSLLKHFRSKEHCSFPSIIIRSNIKINQMPLDAKLSQGRTYKFSIKAPKDYKFEIVQENQTIEFNEDGEYKTIEIQPEKGYLQVKFNKYYELIEYEVE